MFRDEIQQSIERYTPILSFFIITPLTGLICHSLDWYIAASDFLILLNISLTLSAIYLGFTGTAIGELISIIGSTLMDKLYEFNRDQVLIKYVKDSAISSVVLFILCICMIFYPAKDNEGIPVLLFSLWLGCFMSTFFYACRIIYYLFLILEIINEKGRADYNKKNNRTIVVPQNISSKPVRENPFDEEE